MQKRMALFLALCLCLTPLAAPAEQPENTAPPQAAQPGPTAPAYPEPMDGTLRIWLQSLGVHSALGITLDGAYTVEGDRGFQFEPGTELALGVSGGSIMLKAGGVAIDMGGSFTLTRHLDENGQAGGIYIHESEKDTLYAGDVSFANRHGSIRVIVHINVEEYLKGVLPYEMRDTFPMEALKAQAVAARTYAMQRKARATASDEYDLVDTANDQVYKGLDIRQEAPIRAVEETRGVVGMVNGSYAETFFSASNGGQTALASDVWGNGSFPYLDIRDDPYDLENVESMVKTGTVSKDPKALGDALQDLLLADVREQLVAKGEITGDEAVALAEIIKVEGANPLYGGQSRQYGTVRFTLKASVRRFLGNPEDTVRMMGEAEVVEDALVVDLSFYDQVRQALSIGINASKYDLFTVEETEDAFLIHNRRYGHGVGLSQRGAQQMAGQHGMGYVEILQFYYPGLDFVQISWLEPELTPADALPESLGYAAPRPTPAPTPAPLPPLQAGEYYAVVNVAGVDSTLNVREGPGTDTKILGEIRTGSRLIVVEETGTGWAKMKTVEMEGYVSMEYITPEE